MDFQTYFVYFSLILVMLAFAKISAHYAKTRHVPITHFSFLLPILFFSLVIGLRYMVGSDYETYLTLIKNTTSVSYFKSIEPMFKYLMLFIEKYSLHFSYFFIISAFIQIFFFYKSFDRPLLFLLPWAVPLFIMTEIGSLENGVRHFTALMMFFYSLKHIKNQKLVYYVGTILFASLFHKSVLLCLPLYFVARLEVIKSVYLQFCLVLFFLVGSEFLSSLLIRLSLRLIVLFGYENYMESIGQGRETGIGYFVQWFINFIIIGFYPKLKEAYQKNGFLVYWNLFYVGLLLKPMLDLVSVLTRINWYFYKFRFIILAFLLHYLYQHRNNPIYLVFFIIFLFLNIIIFIHGIMQGSNHMSPFYFIWDKL